jgi:hypothetical protein
MNDQEDDRQRFDAALTRLLQKPPEPRLQRKRRRKKPIRESVSEVREDTPEASV